VVSVTALRDDQKAIIGYLLIGTATPRASWRRGAAQGGRPAKRNFQQRQFLEYSPLTQRA